MNEALYFQTVITIIFTVAWMLLQYKQTGLVWRVMLSVTLFILWYSTAGLTTVVYPEIGIVPGLIYYGFSLIAAAYAFIDGVKMISRQDEEWW